MFRTRNVKTETVLFTRHPAPGRAKTRLIPALGAEQAATVQRLMTERAALQLRRFKQKYGVPFRVAFTGHDHHHFRDWLGHDLSYLQQQGDELGERMRNAADTVFADGRRHCLIVGSDCPGISPDNLQEALQALESHQVVIGPVDDGGYWLIGFRREAFRACATDLFGGISWGTGTVYKETMTAAQAADLSTASLTPLQDVDEPEDLLVWESVAEASPQFPPSSPVSVIIPALNEEAVIGKAITSAQAGAEVDITVADGGSTDATRRIARDLSANVVKTTPGRARQMNVALQKTTGGVTIFLHADSVLPLGFDTAVRNAVFGAAADWGSFLLHIDSPDPRIRLIERIANHRAALLKLPYGDQALFMKRDILEHLGGFPEVPIMEDFSLVRQLRKAGYRMARLPIPVATDARRWQQRGIWKTTFVNQAMVLGHYLGISAEKLSRFYRNA